MSTVAAPDTPGAKRFGDLSGKEVKTVSASMTRFCEQYKRPILPQYRTIVNDLIQSTHLTLVDARFKYDAVFALGLHGIYFRLLKSYPGEGEAQTIFDALTNCLDLESASIASDAESLSTWAKSASEADLVAALKGEGDSQLASIARAAKDDEFYLYSKMWGLGLIQMMEGAGIETTQEKVVELVEYVGFPVAKVKQDLVQYKDVLEKALQAEQLFKEIEIREKKKMAERLEEKAKRALAQAQAADAASLAAQQK
ncbi:thylakoid formation protein-domain-containing protein [Tribonema minus]|uniref:Thylakoid formation protein-domain-containing protein n=1 Tax=Tribonema minus TaxID=303371 RepID=A0A836CK23_9STRA|nr:thylakoid formation protein-domain-containing protein [Tribonema minus]